MTETRHVKIVGVCGPKLAQRMPPINPTPRVYLRVMWILTLLYSTLGHVEGGIRYRGATRVTTRHAGSGLHKPR